MITPPGLRTKLTLVSPTQYDWRNVALSIIGNAKTPYDKAKAIYCWLCANISYDTSYKIHNADAAWKNNKGVCQAYCELFYRLGLAVGLDVRIVSGKSKQSDGSVGNVDHAWIAVNISGTIEKKNLFPESITYYDSQSREANFPSTRGLTRQTTILIDPTWGAGKIVNKRFCRSINDMSWFNVEPEWMIFTHYPDNQQDQMLGSASLNKTQFMSLPYAVPKYKGFGFDAKMSLNTLLNKNIKLPEINTDASDYVEFVDIPLS